MTLAHQHIVDRINRRARSKWRVIPFVLVVWFIFAMIIIGSLFYFIGKVVAMRECPPAQSGERLIYSEQREDETVCNYSSGWNMYGRNKIARKTK